MSDMDEQTNAPYQGSDNPVAEKSAEQDAQKPCEVHLQIPVAVYTANRGYDWSELPEDIVRYDEVKLLFEKLMSVKSIYYYGLLPIGVAFKGVIYTGGTYAVAFRLMTAPKWDQARRDVDYCACAFVPEGKLKDVDFERLLDMEYFWKPNHKPAAMLDYCAKEFIAPASDECAKAVCDLKEGNYDNFKWQWIGPILSGFGPFNDEWIFARIDAREGSRFVPKFGDWDEEVFRHPVDGGSQDTSNGEEIQERELLSDAGAAHTDTPFTEGQTTVHDHELQQPEPQDEYMREGSSDDELTNANERPSKKIAEYNALVNNYNKMRERFDNLSRSFQVARQERDDAKRSCQSLQRRIRILEAQGSCKNMSIDLLPVLVAFLLGVVVAFLGIRLLTGFNGSDSPLDGGSYTDDQSVGEIQ